MNRRNFIKNGSTAASSFLLTKAPYAFVKKKYHLRVLGTHVTLQEELRKQAEKDLGITISFHPGGSASVLHQAATNPNSFDLYEQWSNSLKVLWDAGAIQGIDKRRIQKWNEVNPLTKEGKLTSNARYGKGDAPYKLLYVQNDNELGRKESNKVSFLPYVHNVDSIGYNSNIIPQGIPYETESWSWLLDEEYRGKVALINAPTIGLFDMALAAEASGKIKFKDIGNISKDELDKLFKILIDLKEKGHFRGLWNSVPQSVDFMKRDGVAVQSMFSPGVSSLNGMGVPCVYAAPKEGYRAWHGVMCLSSKTTGPAKDAAYEYMNWWLSGWPGAFIARQGYYISTPHLSKKYLTKDEWNYWYQGEATKAPLKNTEGKIAIKAGGVRTGGSYEKRFSNVAVWNTVMDTYEYSLVKWNEFLSMR
jgi:putative spermidine/putrescine transport system substrate-binding protein